MLTESERKIYQLKDKIYKIFDSKNRDKIFTDYHFNFNKCLSEKQISKFESYYKVTLPEDYRNFLKIIGNGGKFHGGFSPGGRFSSLEESYPVRGYREFKKEKRIAFKKIKKAFLYTENIKKNMKIFESLDNRNVHKFNGYQGSLIIDYVAPEIILLEVTGKKPGRIWGVEEDFSLDTDYATVKPINDSFYNWYNDWLDECLKKLEIS